ncbi:MAG: DUF3180 domain-containing protein [Actinomycetota bacterium]|nr:DUF3180 domain-containing protein [Actinomycetota bacterium]MDQ2958691.1 DUF3180 domain-containing protein [Actinomycetota bacterium]
MIRRTNLTDLLVPFGAGLVLSYLLLKLVYESLPPFQWFTALPIAALAVAEFVVAGRVRAAVRHKPQAKPMTALAIARAVALGKATVLVAAAVVGAAVALLIEVVPDAGRTNAAAHDLKVGAALVVVTALLVAGGLVLERAGIDPGHGRG